MSEFNSIDEGVSYDYLIHGLVVLIVVVVIGVFIHPLVSLLGLIAGIGMMAMKSGIQINEADKSIRRYSNIFGYKFGQWTSLKNVTSAKLEYHSESGGRNQISSGIILGTTRTKRNQGAAVKCYPLKFYDDVEMENEFHSFLKMKPAFETVKALEQMNIQVENQLLEMQTRLGSSGRRR